jgi:hypothetical protein
MGGRVADNIDALFVPFGHNGQLGIFFDGMTGIDQLTVYPASKRGFGKAGTNIGGNVVNGNGFGKTAVAAVRQSNNWHDCLLFDSEVIRTKDHV